VWGQSQRPWRRQGRDGLRRSPRGRSGSGRAALSRRACRGWRDLRHAKRAEDGGGWSAGPGARTSQHRAGNARTKRSRAARDGPQRCATAARLQEHVKRSTRGVTGGVAWASLALDRYALYRKCQYYTRQNLSSTVLAHSGYFMLGGHDFSVPLLRDEHGVNTRIP
jgi:hypothetical protein